MPNDMERDGGVCILPAIVRANTVQLPVVQALAATSAIEYLLTEPSALTAFLVNVPIDNRPVLVRELRKCYESVSMQTGTAMSPLRIPSWLT